MLFRSDAEIPVELAVTTLTAQAVAGAIGGIFWGWLTERIHLRWLMAAAFAGEAASCLLLFQTLDYTLATVFAVAFGFNFGGLQTFQTIVFSSYFGRKASGAINGIASPPQLLANATGPLVAGVLYDQLGSYTFGFKLLIANYLLGAMWMLMAAPPKAPEIPAVRHGGS